MFNTVAQKPPCSFFRQSHLLTPLLSEEWRRLLPRWYNTRLRGTVPHDLANSQWQHLAPSCEPICLSTNTRIVQPSSPCRGKASHNVRLFQPPILPHSFCPAPSPACSHYYPHSIFLSHVTPINHPPQRRGLSSCHFKRRGLRLPENVRLGCCSKDVILFYRWS